MLNTEKLKTAAIYVGFSDAEIVKLDYFWNRANENNSILQNFEIVKSLLLEPNGLAKIKENNYDKQLGLENSRPLFLTACLDMVESAVTRRQARGIEESTTKATLTDLSLWTRALQRFNGPFGFDFDILEWAQTYLQGDLIRIGTFNFRLIKFPYNIRVYRNKNQLRASSLVNGLDKFEFDLSKGRPNSISFQGLGSDWITVLEPNSTLLRIHIPVDAKMDFAYLMRCTKTALDIFSKISPQERPVGICGESWLFGEEIVPVIKNPLLSRLFEFCSFYPSAITEANTIRRLFGPEVKRTDLPNLYNEDMSSLLKMIIKHLENPNNTLLPRSAFILNQELQTIPEFYESR